MPIRLIISSLVAGLLAAPSPAQHAGQSGPDDCLGGVATVRDTSPNAFGYPAPILSHVERRRFLVGNSFFKQNWVESPASASERDGLGPLFNARSCSACHLRDGRSAPPAAGDHERHGLLIRIGVRSLDGPDRPHPVYGGQIQDDAVQGVAPEAEVAIDHECIGGVYGDGAPFELLRPTYSLTSPAYGEPGEGVTIGPRVAPQLIGLGLLEAVPLATLQLLADPDDADGDGISGRVHYLDEAQLLPGRFGWKATKATVRAQTAAAFVNDMGITSRDEPAEVVTPSQRAIVMIDEAEPEIRDKTFAQVVFYTQALAVPAQRDAHAPAVRRGAALFAEFGCVACHVPELTTGTSAFHAAYAEQRIRPYTDLLLHDLGEGLADEKRDGDARPAEWRTPPLWGLGLLEVVSGHTRLLHDGRARSIEEAVLWHGGEAERARERFRNADATARAALLAFLRSI